MEGTKATLPNPQKLSFFLTNDAVEDSKNRRFRVEEMAPW